MVTVDFDMVVDMTINVHRDFITGVHITTHLAGDGGVQLLGVVQVQNVMMPNRIDGHRGANAGINGNGFIV